MSRSMIHSQVMGKTTDSRVATILNVNRRRQRVHWQRIEIKIHPMGPTTTQKIERDVMICIG